MLSWAVSWREGRKFVYTREGSWAGISPLKHEGRWLGVMTPVSVPRGQATRASLLHCQTDIYYQCNYNNYYIYACLLFNSALTICTVQDRCKLSLYKGTPFIYIHDPCLQARPLSTRHVVGLLHVVTFSNVSCLTCMVYYQCLDVNVLQIC